MITKISSLKFINLSDTRKIGKILQNRVPGNMRKYLTKTLPRSRETIPPSLNVLAHEHSVKFTSQGVIDWWRSSPSCRIQPLSNFWTQHHRPIFASPSCPTCQQQTRVLGKKQKRLRWIVKCEAKLKQIVWYFGQILKKFWFWNTNVKFLWL